MTEPYIAACFVVPTRTQFEGAVARLDVHLAAMKRIKLASLSPEELAAEYERFSMAFEAYETFSRHEVSGFMRDWWRIDPIEDVDRVRRRSNRQRNLALGHKAALRDALMACGPAGIAELRRLFLTGDDYWVWRLQDVARDHFPDEAEPVFEALLALPDDGLLGWHQRSYREMVKTIRGYRARRAGDMAPELAVGEEAGLAPALATLDRSPAEFPAELFERFGHHVLAGDHAYYEAIIAAWCEVIADQRLDPRHLEPAELARFDPRFASQVADPVYKYYSGRLFIERLQGHGFDYVYPDGRPVTPEELERAFTEVMQMNHEHPYVPAANWRRR